jgi:hypothetical protein
MLDKRIVKEGVLIYEDGKILLDGFEANAPCMCREIAVLAQLHVAQKLIADALKGLDVGNQSDSAIGVPNYHPRSYFNPLAMLSRGERDAVIKWTEKWEAEYGDSL